MTRARATLLRIGCGRNGGTKPMLRYCGSRGGSDSHSQLAPPAAAAFSSHAIRASRDVSSPCNSKLIHYINVETEIGGHVAAGASSGHPARAPTGRARQFERGPAATRERTIYTPHQRARWLDGQAKRRLRHAYAPQRTAPSSPCSKEIRAPNGCGIGINTVMAGLDPATQCAHVRARERVHVPPSRGPGVLPPRCRANWVAGTRPAMTTIRKVAWT
jgi:hypothetical protein